MKLEFILLMAKSASNKKQTSNSSLSAGIIPVLKTRDPKFLLLRVYNYWDFPKGLVEKGEVPLQAAIRELAEETGIKEVKFSWGEDFIETDPYRGGKIARYYIGEVFKEDVTFGINPALGRAEHHEYRWVTVKQAEPLLVPRVWSVLEWAHKKITVSK